MVDKTEKFSHLVTTDEETGIVIRENYYVNDRYKHNPNGAAYIERDRVTGVTTIEKYYINGRLHRDGEPALIKRDGKTSEAVEVEYWQNGQRITPKQNESHLERVKSSRASSQDRGI